MINVPHQFESHPLRTNWGYPVGIPFTIPASYSDDALTPVPTSATHRIRLQPAYILHRRPYRETSLILDAFSREHGRVALLAKGVRTGKAQRSEVLSPFRALLLSWSGRGDLPLLTAAETTAGQALPLRGVAIYCGLYLNELLQAFLHRHDPHPALFGYYAEALAALADERDAEAALRRFELLLLQELGYGLQLQYDVDQGAAVDPDGYYRYIPDQGPTATPGSGVAIRGATLIALREGRVEDAASRREAKNLLRRVIHHHLAGRPLKSRELFRYQR